MLWGNESGLEQSIPWYVGDIDNCHYCHDSEAGQIDSSISGDFNIFNIKSLSEKKNRQNNP